MQVGESFPGAAVHQVGGQPASVASLLGGHPAVVYFYPKDNTPGCTLEAHDFQRLLPQFKQAGVSVFGVSVDDAASHEKFTSDCGLQFPLLMDIGGTLGTALGILNDRGMTSRTTYLLDGTGQVRRIWQNVKVDGHADEVLAAAQAL